MPSTSNTSNFQTVAPVTGGLPGTAPAVFTASTTDDETTITKAGYINDFYIRQQFKDLDLVIINYEGGKHNGLFLVENKAKAGDPPQAQLVKVVEPPTPPPKRGE